MLEIIKYSELQFKNYSKSFMFTYYKNNFWYFPHKGWLLVSKVNEYLCHTYFSHAIVQRHYY